MKKFTGTPLERTSDLPCDGQRVTDNPAQKLLSVVPPRSEGRADGIDGPDALVLLIIGAMATAGCTNPTAPAPPPVGGIRLLVDVTTRPELPGAQAGLPVAAGVFLTIPPSYGSAPSISSLAATARIRGLLEDTNAILRQCDLYVFPEAAQVISIPPHLVTVQGNEPGSWGGHPPASLGDPDFVMYHENERLTSDARELFGYGKRHTSQNAIAIFVVEEIEYYIGQQRVGASGLSFAPVIYHHADDYPLRNSVLIQRTGRDASGLPSASGRTVAHEFGHMLLNTGDHVADSFSNLMIGGTDLTPEQCDRMRANRERLFGSAAVPDPGPPTSG
jgi:hypothetical protein